MFTYIKRVYIKKKIKLPNTIKPKKKILQNGIGHFKNNYFK